MTNNYNNSFICNNIRNKKMLNILNNWCQTYPIRRFIQGLLINIGPRHHLLKFYCQKIKRIIILD